MGGGVTAYFNSHFSRNLSQWKKGSYDSYLWLRVNKGAAPNLFVCGIRCLYWLQTQERILVLKLGSRYC